MHIRRIATEEDLRQVAEWSYSEWGHTRSDNSVEKLIELYRARINSDLIPITLVGTVGSEIVGMASLVENEARDFPELTPFLSALYVSQMHRRNGYAEGLVEEILKYAKQHGYEACHLITDKFEQLYNNLGWSTIRTYERNEKTIKVMSIATCFRNRLPAHLNRKR